MTFCLFNRGESAGSGSVRENVERGSGDGAGVEGFDECGFVNEAAACAVDDANAGRILAKASRPMMPRVSSVTGVWIVRKSAAAKTSSSEPSVMPNSPAMSLAMNGS